MNFNEVIHNIKNSFLSAWESFIAQVPSIVIAILVIALGIILANILTRAFRKTISKRTQDPLMTNFLSKSLKIVLVILIIMLALNVAGLGGIAAGMLTAAGASAVIIGFAFKDIGENFISGVILSFNRPFDVNDTVKIGDIFGSVKNMEFRYTKIKTFDGRDVYVPNSDIIKEAVYNYTEDGYYRLDFTVGIAYEDNVADALALVLRTVREAEGVVKDDSHESFVTVEELATSTVNLKVFFWVKTVDYKKQAHQIKSDVMGKVKDAIIENDMNMPADIQEIKLYGSQTSIPVSISQEQ
ncbi:MAG: mechanosensitive ion channel [Bacteroidota bacterium]